VWQRAGPGGACDRLPGAPGTEVGGGTGASHGTGRADGSGHGGAIRELAVDAEPDAPVSVLGRLWSGADPGSVRSWGEERGYHRFGPFDGDTGAGSGELVAVAGGSVQRVLHRRHVWVHDLVVDEPRRSEGVGVALSSSSSADSSGSSDLA
jgi:hypothetical protein